MQAKTGFAFSLRSRSWIVGICMAVALVATGLTASAASAKPVLPPSAYVALGDSISFGYTQQKFEENFPTEPPSAFEGGFVNRLAKKLTKNEKEAGYALNIANLACPGEVSDGLVGENPLLGGGGEANGKPDDAPCGWHNVDGFPRHVEYGPVSQFEAAIGAVTNLAVPVHLVTINIGSNDELAIVAACETRPTWPNTASSAVSTNASSMKPGQKVITSKGGAFGHIISNTGDVIGVLRAFGYTGPVAIVGFYNPQAIVLPGSDALQIALNEAFEFYVGGGAFGPGVLYVNPFPVFNPQKGNRVEQKAICKFTEFCNEHDKKANLEKIVGHPVTEEEAAAYPIGDIHPTPEGYNKIANLIYKALGYHVIG